MIILNINIENKTILLDELPKSSLTTYIYINSSSILELTLFDMVEKDEGYLFNFKATNEKLLQQYLSLQNVEGKLIHEKKYHTLEDIIDDGFNASFSHDLKRMDGKWYTKISWECCRIDDFSMKSSWEGYDNYKEALNNLIQRINCV